MKGKDHNTRRLVLLILLPLISACSVRHLKADPAPRRPRPISQDLNRRYLSPDRGLPRVKLTLKDEGPEYLHYVGRFSCRAPGAEIPHEVSFDYYQSRESKAPVIVCTPILGGKGALERGVAKSFAMRGLHAVLVHRAQRFFKKPIRSEQIEIKFRSAIADRRRVIDWLCERPEVDETRIGAFGISMGAIVTSVLTPIEPRIHSSVICMAGGDLGAVISVSSEKPLVKYRKIRMEKEGKDLATLKEELRQAIDSDPLYLARYCSPDRFFMFISIYDSVVPTPFQIRLRNALGKPETVLIPTGHYTAILFLPLLRKMTIDYFKKRFEKPNMLRPKDPVDAVQNKP